MKHRYKNLSIEEEASKGSLRRRDDAVAGVQAEAKYLLAWEASDSIIFLHRKPCFLHYLLLILQEKIVDLNGPFLFKVSLPYCACPSL